MANKLFSDKIQPACKYCVNVVFIDGVCCCEKKKNSEVEPDGRCFRYKYNPLERIPEIVPDLPKYNAEDFSID